MTRWVGGLLVAGCGLWLGLQRTVWYTRRVEALQEILEALSLMEWELKDRDTPLPELMARLERGTRGTLRCFFQDCGSQFSELGAHTFEEIWSGAAERTQFPLSGEEQMLFRGLGQVLGRYDQESQRHAIAQSRAQLAARLEEAREERDRQGRLSGVVGGAVGLLTVLLLM